MQLSSHTKRMLTGLVLLFILAVSLYYKETVLFFTLCFFSSVALFEFYNLFWKESDKHLPLRILATITGVVILANYYLPVENYLHITFFSAFWAGNLYFLFSYSKNAETANYTDALIFFAGIMYIPFALHFLLYLSLDSILYILLTVAISDVVAFYTGSLFGKKKIWPQISPKKSWAGSIGGLIGAITFAFAYNCYLEYDIPLALIFCLALFMNLASQFGDFFESGLKRKYGVKDSGTILPGHGGILDRFDSLFFAAPMYIFFQLFHPFFE